MKAFVAVLIMFLMFGAGFAAARQSPSPAWTPCPNTEIAKACTWPEAECFRSHCGEGKIRACITGPPGVSTLNGLECTVGCTAAAWDCYEAKKP